MRQRDANVRGTSNGSTTPDRDKLTANKLTTNNANWLKRAILNIFLLSLEPKLTTNNANWLKRAILNIFLLSLEPKLTTNNANWLKRAILNIFLLPLKPSCPNPHFVTKSVRRHHCNKIFASRSVCSWSVDLARHPTTI